MEFEFSAQFPHPGSLAIYMADCGGDCQKVKVAELEWFKVKEEGLEHVNSDGTRNESRRMCRLLENSP